MAAGVDKRNDITSEVSEKNGLAQEVTETNEIITEVPERNELGQEVSETDEIMPGLSERNGLAREVSDTDETTTEMPERSEATGEETNGSRAIRDASHSGAFSRTLSHSMYQHTISYKFSVLNLREKKSFRFQACFDTGCQAGPTSWLCEVVFERVAVDGTSCIIFKLKRTDSAGDTVELNASLDVKDATARPLFCIPSIQRRVVGSGQLIDLYLFRKFRTPEEVSSFNFKLDVRVDILVSLCHLELDLGGECLIL